MDHKKSKKCLKIANEEIFIAFTYLLIDFVLLWHKITKIENTFKTHNQLKHGTIIRTGIKCKEISCYMSDSACRWFIILKYFEVMLNIFEFSRVPENVES